MQLKTKEDRFKSQVWIAEIQILVFIQLLKSKGLGLDGLKSEVPALRHKASLLTANASNRVCNSLALLGLIETLFSRAWRTGMVNAIRSNLESRKA